MKSWHEIFISHEKLGKMSNLLDIPEEHDHCIPAGIILIKSRAGTFGSEENRKRDNKQSKKHKRERGDIYRPLSGYVFHPFYRRYIFVENALVAQNQWWWWFTMPLDLDLE